MKKLFSALVAVSLLAVSAFFMSCVADSDYDASDPNNPTVSLKASTSLDFIFNTDSVGFTTITIRRSEWNKMLSYYDYFYKNENNVAVESYEYEKDGKKWKLNNAGLRLRGNTSRFRPQGKDHATDETGHHKDNDGWSDFYSNEGLKDIYRQSHFKVDFLDNKMSKCMKGVALKRCDTVFSREIFCYNLFHEYGIWTAPRASQTKVYIDFVEDVNEDGTLINDKSDCDVTRVDFGVYEMFEEVNKQSLKGRMSKKGNNTAFTAWKNNDGDLWKCSGGNLTAGSNTSSNFGCEYIKIIDTTIPREDWGSNNWKWERYSYDLKTNKDEITRATAYFQQFLTELNSLSDISQFTDQGIIARKNFYEKWFDVDFFIKTYAVNMLCGMDDDYWGNQNNYYLYFDNGNGGSGKCYLIPFDYDNTLGNSITGDKVTADPFSWGNGNDRPLMDRLLEVPEYVLKLKKTLLEVSSQNINSPWNKYNCFILWDDWLSQVSPYVYSADLAESNISAKSIYDGGGNKGNHYLTKNISDNIYEQTSESFKNWLTKDDEVIYFDLNGGTVNGQYGEVVGYYTGVSKKFSAITDEPVREGYEFIGWTETDEGSDYVEEYNGSSRETVYASWHYTGDLTGLSIFEIPDSAYNGIKFCIVNLPENNYRRTFYMRKEGETDFIEIGGDAKDGSKYKKIWAYPFTESGKTYEFYVSYSDVNYHWLAQSNTVSVVAGSGEGEFKVTNTPEYYIENNILKWTTKPELQIGDGRSPLTDDNWNEYYLLEVQSTDSTETPDQWNYISWNYLGAACDNDFNFKYHLDDKGKVLAGIYKNLCFRLSYIYNSSSYGNLQLIIYNYRDTSSFNIN